MAETLDFEEPIAKLLKELDSLTVLPGTDAHQRSIDTLRHRLDTLRGEVYASLTPCTPTARASTDSSSGSSPGLSRFTAIAGLPTTTRS